MENKDKGYVYILTNPSFREDWVKIGKSSRPVDIRSKELDNTAEPLLLKSSQPYNSHQIIHIQPNYTLYESNPLLCL